MYLSLSLYIYIYISISISISLSLYIYIYMYIILQEHNGKEIVGAAFSLSTSGRTNDRAVTDGERIIKAAQYISKY